jgi:hypothetical protein
MYLILYTRHLLVATLIADLQTYNFLAQKDNMLNIEVARDSKLIALASSRDSMSMKTIALLTIAFLPGTFVAVSIPVLSVQILRIHEGLSGNLKLIIPPVFLCDALI